MFYRKFEGSRKGPEWGPRFVYTLSSIEFRMVLIASGLFFVWCRGRFSENSGGDSRKMFLKQEKKYCIYIYGIWYFKKTAHCSKRFVLSSLRQETTRKSHYCGGKTLQHGERKNKITNRFCKTNQDKSRTLMNKTVARRKLLRKFRRNECFLFC